MKNLNLFFSTAFFLLANCTLVCGQQIINFSTIDPSEVQIDADKAEIRVANSLFKEAAFLFDNKSEIRIKTNDIERISFWYSLEKASDNCVLILESQLSNSHDNNWKEIKLIELMGEKVRTDYVFTESVINSAQAIGNITLRFRLEYPDKNGKGNVYIDSITITKLSPEKKEALEKDNEMKGQITIVEDEFKKFGEKNCKHAQAQYDRIKLAYLKGFQEIKTISYRSKIFELIGELSKYSENRSQMGNPIAYQEFENILDSISFRSDELTKKILSDYTQQLKAVNATGSNSTSSTSKNSFAKIFNVISNVANVVSAGKVDNVINSVKSIVGTIFNKPILESKYPIRDWVYDKKEKIVSAVTNDENVKMVEAELSNGIKFLDEINGFVNIAKVENENFLSDLKKTSEITYDAVELSDDADMFILNYFSDIDVLITMEEINEKLNKVNVQASNEFEDKILSFFKNATPDCTKASAFKLYQDDIVRLEKLNINAGEVNSLYERYIKLTDNLKNHYRNLEAALKSRQNPFDEEKYPLSFNKYKELQDNSLTSLSAINELLTELFPDEGK